MQDVENLIPDMMPGISDIKSLHFRSLSTVVAHVNFRQMVGLGGRGQLGDMQGFWASKAFGFGIDLWCML